MLLTHQQQAGLVFLSWCVVVYASPVGYAEAREEGSAHRVRGGGKTVSVERFKRSSPFLVGCWQPTARHSWQKRKAWQGRYTHVLHGMVFYYGFILVINWGLADDLVHYGTSMNESAEHLPWRSNGELGSWIFFLLRVFLKFLVGRADAPIVRFNKRALLTIMYAPMFESGELC